MSDGHFIAYGACCCGLDRMYGLVFNQYRFLKADDKNDGFLFQILF